MYRIREVDGHDDEIADMLTDLHRLTFFGGAPLPEFDQGHWWLAYSGDFPVAFAGARYNGWTSVISDTTDNLASANNFIRGGYRLYRPQYPWAWPNTLHWRKFIKQGSD